jgi:hypothetical protein
MIKKVTDLPDNVIGFSASGLVTAQDYETVIIPTVEAKLSDSKKIRLLYHLGSEFAGFEMGALWDDAKIGLQHLTEWERIAVVTDNDWLRSAIKVLGFIIPGQVRVFTNDQLAEAKAWLSA